MSQPRATAPVTPFSALPAAVRFQLAVLGPFLFGAVCGFLLSVNEAAYWVSQALGAVGGVIGGSDHRGARAGAARGLVAGTLFGAAIVIAHESTGRAALARVPDPLGVLIVLTALGGTVLGALGGALSARRG